MNQSNVSLDLGHNKQLKKRNTINNVGEKSQNQVYDQHENNKQLKKRNTINNVGEKLQNQRYDQHVIPLNTRIIMLFR